MLPESVTRGFFLLICFACVSNWANAQSVNSSTVRSPSGICRLIENEARKNGLPPSYFARLIWAESRFDPNAVSDEGEQGIAQFSPQLAEQRRLEDPFDPSKAIPEAAEYLAYLRVKFGNLGLAVAAYDAGEEVVERWLVGQETLVQQTRTQVQSITGEEIDVFRQRRRHIIDRPLEAEAPFSLACRRLAGETIDQNMGQLLGSPWAIQVAGHFNREIAVQRWNIVKDKHADLVADHPVAIGKVATSIGRTEIFAVRIGMDSRVTANALCRSLRARGTACIVTKN